MLSAERPEWVTARAEARIGSLHYMRGGQYYRPRLTGVDLGGVQALAAFVAFGVDPVADYLLPF